MKKIWNKPTIVKLTVSETMASNKKNDKIEYHNGSTDKTARILS